MICKAKQTVRSDGNVVNSIEAVVEVVKIK